jgi:hypothetical protein
MVTCSHGHNKTFLVPDSCRGTARNGNSINFDALMTPVIPETCHAQYIGYIHLYWLRVPNEGYFINVSCAIKWISTSLLVFQYFDFESTLSAITFIRYAQG